MSARSRSTEYHWTKEIFSEVCSSNIVTWQTYSALFILRSVTKYFIEIDSEQNLHPYFLPNENSGELLNQKAIDPTTRLFRSTIIDESFRWHIVSHDDRHPSDPILISSTLGSVERLIISLIHSDVCQRSGSDQRNLQYFHASTWVSDSVGYRRLLRVFL